MMLIQDAVQNARRRLLEAGIQEARLEAELLVAEALHQSRSWVIAHAPDLLDEKAQCRLDGLLGRRIKREPLAYLLGRREFYGLEFIVNPDVLIPRQETELLVEIVSRWAVEQEDALVIEVGAGSGCIGIALAALDSTLIVLAIERSPAALKVASENAQRLAEQLSGNYRTALGNWLETVQDASASAVVANLPYVGTKDKLLLEPEVKDWEPEMALYAGEEGLDAFKIVIPEAKRVLKPKGLLALEIGLGQSEAVKALMKEAGFKQINVYPDLAGIPRVVSGISS